MRARRSCSVVLTLVLAVGLRGSALLAEDAAPAFGGLEATAAGVDQARPTATETAEEAADAAVTAGLDLAGVAPEAVAELFVLLDDLAAGRPSPAPEVTALLQAQGPALRDAWHESQALGRSDLAQVEEAHAVRLGASAAPTSAAVASFIRLVAERRERLGGLAEQLERLFAQDRAQAAARAGTRLLFLLELRHEVLVEAARSPLAPVVARAEAPARSGARSDPTRLTVTRSDRQPVTAGTSAARNTPSSAGKPSRQAANSQIRALVLAAAMGAIDRARETRGAPADPTHDGGDGTGAGALDAAATDGTSRVALAPSVTPSVKRRLRREVLRPEVSADVKLFEADLAECVALSARYRWAVEAGDEAGFQTRVDRWIVSQDLNVGDVITGLGPDVPVVLDLHAGGEILFTRQFRTAAAAAAAAPYTPLQLPFTAQKARDLQVGDFVSLPVTLKMVVGADLSSVMLDGMVGGASRGMAASVVSGSSRVNVLKVDDRRVRLRLISTREVAAKATAGVDPGFTLTSLKPLSDLVGVELDRPQAAFEAERFRDAALSWDLLFDLDEPEAARAYESIMRSSLRLRVLSGPNPLRTGSRAAESFLSDLRPAEQLAAKSKGVTLLLQGANRSEGTRGAARFALSLCDVDEHSLWGWNRMLDEKTAPPRRFVMPVFSSFGGRSFLQGVSHEEMERTNYAVLDADQAWTPTGVARIVASLAIRDQLGRRSELGGYVEQLEAGLGPELVAALGGLAGLRGRLVRGLAIELTLSCSGSLSTSMFGAAADDEASLWRALTAVAEAVPPPVRAPGFLSLGKVVRPGPPASLDRTVAKRIEATARDEDRVDWAVVKKAADLVRRARQASGAKAKAEALFELARTPWMREAFIRLLVELARPFGADGLAAHLVVSGDGVAPIDRTVGHEELTEVFDAVQGITYNVNDRRFGMR